MRAARQKMLPNLSRKTPARVIAPRRGRNRKRSDRIANH